MKSRQFSRGNPKGLQENDIIRPIKGRVTSNGYKLSAHPKLKITKVFRSYWNDKFLTIYCKSPGSNWIHTVFADAFELCELEEEYSIY